MDDLEFMLDEARALGRREGAARGERRVLKALRTLGPVLKALGVGGAVVPADRREAPKYDADDLLSGLVTKAVTHAPKGGATVFKAVATCMSDPSTVVGLQSHLENMGYTDDEIQAGLNDVQDEILTLCGGQ